MNMRKSSFLSVAIGMCLCTSLWAHGVPIYLTVGADQRLQTDTATYSSQFNLVAGLLLTTDLPGVEIKNPSDGLLAGDEIDVNVLDKLLYWDGAGLAAPSASLLLENQDGQPWTITGDSTAMSGLYWGTYSGQTGWHQHGDFTLEPKSAPLGVYALVLQLASPNYGPSAPFVVGFNNGLSDEVADVGLEAIATLVFSHSTVLGDLNGNGAVNNLDIDPFSLALTDPAAFHAAFPNVSADSAGDINQDGALNNLDIDPFARLLTGGAQAAAPEPRAFGMALVGVGIALGFASQKRRSTARRCPPS